MILYENVLKKIKNAVTRNAKEIGGILGGKNNIILEVIIDYGEMSNFSCIYIPGFLK